MDRGLSIKVLKTRVILMFAKWLVVACGLWLGWIGPAIALGQESPRPMW